MRKFILFLIFCVFSTMSLMADGNEGKESKELKGVITANRSSQTGSIQRSPLFVDLVFVIEDEKISILFMNDYGTGTYRISDAATGTTITSTVNTSLVNYLSIPIHITDSSDMDFYIEFEDGCWCHLVWNQSL